MQDFVPPHRDTAAIGSLLTPVSDFVSADLLQCEAWIGGSPDQFGSGRLAATRGHEKSSTWQVASQQLCFPRTLSLIDNNCGYFIRLV
jgi:hypothetical protein